MYSTSKNWDNDSCTTQTCFRANICDVASEAIEVNYFEAAKELCISVEPLKKFSKLYGLQQPQRSWRPTNELSLNLIGQTVWICINL